MAYFNYHSKIKKLVEEHHLLSAEIIDNWNGIKPAMVLYFDNNQPMPIREYRFEEYYKLFQKLNIKVEIENKTTNTNEVKQV